MTFFGLFSPSKNKKLEKVKALRDDVAWLDGFNLGFSKAWDMMIPVMTEGVTKMQGAIRDKAITETLEGLESTIEKRMEQAGLATLKDTNTVIAKKKEFEVKLSNAKTDEEREKYTHYLDVINWVLNGNILQKTK